MTRHVLVPVDDSDPSTEALRYALESHAEDRITALHVLDPSDFYAATGMDGGTAGGYDRIQAVQDERAERILAEATDLAAEYEVDIETDRVTGGVSRSVLEYIDEHDVDHVVLGSHGRTGASRILLGSVAEKIVRRSPVPATVVR